MKRKLFSSIVIAILALTISCCALVGCTPKDPQNINIVVPDGSPAIAIAKLVNDNPTYKGYNITYSVVQGATQISAAILNDTAQIAIAPLNLGATMYNNNLGIKLVTTNIQGSLYMVGKNVPEGNNSREKLEKLKGKVVYNIGQGATPDLTFRYILDSFGIGYTTTVTDPLPPDKITFNYVTEGSELIQLLKKGDAEYGILGEPAVSRANANTQTTTIFDIQALWSEATSSQSVGFPQAGMFVKDTLLTSEHADFINWLVEKIAENDDWAKQNPQAVTTALSGVGSTALNGLNSNMIAACNIATITAADAKASVNTYLGALYKFNPKSIGGRMPEDDFFYIIK